MPVSLLQARTPPDYAHNALVMNVSTTIAFWPLATSKTCVSGLAGLVTAMTALPRASRPGSGSAWTALPSASSDWCLASAHHSGAVLLWEPEADEGMRLIRRLQPHQEPCL